MELVRKITWPKNGKSDHRQLIEREWLVTNGLGGYASGTLAGALTRRYHALLIAALGAPYGRMVLLNHILECLITKNNSIYCIGAEQSPQSDIIVHGAAHLLEFRLEQGIPIWKYQIDGHTLEKRILMPHLQNTVHITYSLLKAADDCTLELRPSLQFRNHDAALGEKITKDYSLTAKGNRYEIRGEKEFPVLRILVAAKNGKFTLDGGTSSNIHHFIEAQRGYDALARLWSPGIITAAMAEGESVTLIASCEPWDNIEALSPQNALQAERTRRTRLIQSAVPEARGEVSAELVIAADQFIVSPVGRAADAVRTHASGDEVRSVIAGYHWFTDWGRDTFISFEGLTLVTGRFTEAGWILRTFAHYIRDGLIPNLFPEGQNEGLYNTADATLWFFHALDRYLHYTGDRATLRLLMDPLIKIVERHIKGTLFGIGTDPSDGLLRQGLEGYQLTWMDAKVDNWVVTPRRGKAVEINALWYNALRLLQNWITEERGAKESQYISDLAEKIALSFNKRFWYKKGGYLYDVVDGEEGDDTSFRPNQILAISLQHPVLDKHKWSTVVDKVKQKLFTPVGLRSLSPDHPDYKEKYFGDLLSRDAAYHQGTVWAWLIGPFIDAWLKVHPQDYSGAHQFLKGFYTHLSESCVGSISEVFDAESPYTPRGCIAQAWSVAEVLRCLVKTGSNKS